MYQALRVVAEHQPRAVAYDFLGTTATYGELLKAVDRCAGALSAQGIARGDRVTVALPNTPHAVIAFYALNKLGAVAGMIHPLSAPSEIEFYLKISGSSWAVTLDAFYPKFREVLDHTKVNRLLLCEIGDFLSPVKRLGFWLTSGRKIPSAAEDSQVIYWRELMSTPFFEVSDARMDPDELAVILYSGGTTGTPKGIMLSSMNFNALAQQLRVQGPLKSGDVMLSILPVFHGFGLGVCIHTFLVCGGTCVLVPRFTPESVAKLVKGKRPQWMAGVPTLFEALASNPQFRRTDLRCLEGAFSGGDRLPRETKERFEAVVRSNGGQVPLREGYGLTESVTACVLMPKGEYREASIGIPFSDTLAKVVGVDSTDEVPPNTEGEICISGPTVMQGYLDDPAATNEVLKTHSDGIRWLHTGDLGTMDEDGFLYFRQRLKRIIKVSGVSVYPTQVEEVLDAHPTVAGSCVIGVPDAYKIQKVKAFVKLVNPDDAGESMKQTLREYCKKHLITWSVPREIEFRDNFPTTLVGKVAYKTLEQEERERYEAGGIEPEGGALAPEQA
jgi:long-chain acyl-CoA synthetase